jgi:hypothetical protein
MVSFWAWQNQECLPNRKERQQDACATKEKRLNAGATKESPGWTGAQYSTEILYREGNPGQTKNG